MIIRLAIIIFTLALLTSCSSAPKSTITGTKPYTVRGEKYYPLQSAHGFVEEGVASWYGPGFHGKTTANGETYNQYAMTAAHKLLPLGTTVRVTNLENNESIVLRINDRGPFVHDRIIDVSKKAADLLDMRTQGIAKVRVEAINTKSYAATASKAIAKSTKTYGKSSLASSSSAIEEARKSRVLNEDGEIPDELRYLFEDEGSANTSSTVKSVSSKAKSVAKTTVQASTEQIFDGSGVFYIQVGEFKVKKFASFLAEKFEDKGFPARSYKEPNQDLWRVRIGPWSNEAKAEEFLPRFSQDFGNAQVVIGKAKR